jgi:hypothetical protein
MKGQLLSITIVTLLLSSGFAEQHKLVDRRSTESAARNEKVMTGVISDAICGRRHAMSGKSDVE